MTSELPLLSLHMIVKNEARSIEHVLATARPFIDTWDILDTGSTDGTVELIEKSMSGIPGRLHREPVVTFEDTDIIDFGETRQRSLDLAAPHAVFTFWMSGDEYLYGGSSLREFCAQRRDRTEACHVATVRYDALHTDRHFLFRCGAGARWNDPIHEWVSAPSWGDRLPEDVFTLHTGADPRGRQERYVRDLQVLERLASRAPSSHRYAYYYAQTLECLGRHAEAASAYQRRVSMGGWDEESFSAAWIGARELAASGAPWPEALSMFLDAHAMKPRRAEPLFEIASHYARLDQHGPAYTFAQAAASCPLPDHGAHFVQHDVYTRRALELVAIHAWYAGSREQGRLAAEKLVEMFPKNELYAKNLSFYTGNRHVSIGNVSFSLRTVSFGDEQIYDEVVRQDDYRLKALDLPDNATIVDAGCHVGIFAATACDRYPTARVVGIEMDSENARLAVKHLSALGGRAEVTVAGLVGERRPAGYVPHANNTGGNSVSYEPRNGIVEIDFPVTLKQILSVRGVTGRVDLLKMDIESAEHEVISLAASDGTLDRVDRIAMEWHAWRPGETMVSLVSLLESAGFMVDAREGRCADQGTIFARKPNVSRWDDRTAAEAELRSL